MKSRPNALHACYERYVQCSFICCKIIFPGPSNTLKAAIVCTLHRGDAAEACMPSHAPSTAAPYALHKTPLCITLSGLAHSSLTA